MSIVRLISLIALVFIVVLGYRFATSSGVFRTLEPVSFGACEILPGPTGPEDITIDPRNGLAYISSDDRRRYLLTGDFEGAPNGSLWTLDTRQPNSMPVMMKHDLDGIFHPHGIALDPVRNELYVVNHISNTEHKVEVFRITSPSSLKLRRSITYPELISPNDIIVVGQDQFYVSNDHGNPRGTIMELIEVYLTIPLSSVSYFDGNEGHLAITGVRMANGLAISEDHQTLYVSATMENSLLRYERGESPLDWQRTGSVFTGAAVDNLEWTEAGTLLTGAHPHPLTFLEHSKDASIPSPSEVIEFNVRNEPMTSETIFLDLGKQVSGSSVATITGNTLLIGTVYDEQLTRCIR